MRIGVLGGGQLGRMLALAGLPMGLRFRFYDPDPSAPAGAVGELVTAPWEDTEMLDWFADGLDVITCEFENVPAAAARHLAELVPLRPGTASLEASQDRIVEKRVLAAAGFEVAPYRPVGSRGELHDAIASLGLPALLKTRSFGYDGRGQARIDGPAEADRAWERLGGSPLILERRVPFARELSILAVQGADGAVVSWPAVENLHRGGILRRSLAPAEVPARLWAEVERRTHALLEALDHIGVLTVELFDCGDHLVANEMAPRVHNSGHWTIEGAVTSQFENHLRAVCGLPLGPVAPRGAAAMLNLIGAMPPLRELAAVAGAHVHVYGKAPRPNRKLGHVTVVEASRDGRDRVLERLAALLTL